MTTTSSPVSAPTRIVVGADFTPASKTATDRAKFVAACTGSTLTLAHVVPEASVVAVAPPGEDVAVAMPSPTQDGAAALKAASLLADERVTADLEGVPSEAVVRAGRPHEQLAAIADARGAWLLVVGGADGAGPSETLVLHTTAERALRHGATPVLIARRTDVGAYRRVLLPLEPDDLALLAARSVARLAPDATYDVVHFLPVSDPSGTPTHRDAVAGALAGLCAAGGLDASRTRVSVMYADPWKRLSLEIRRRDPDLVAMGTHARSGVSRVAFGSLADHVIHFAAGVDVLAVPPEQRRAANPSESAHAPHARRGPPPRKESIR